ncbi:hypothetical protein PCYB_001920 [Plasmodium cynomolgi strain B]|uniref:CYIR protein n=1 Tax=Plasmodium cynomolgi (strain B) TaxID=1120755 RepID=K6UZM5_PLACD|nr:hypothetical protein PCYB_001920 [Plasmodium cynomolgi strain B]GAB69444.1 hypothetical protein PCYB_001920 [Plasmodium cynomolgi strain B]
MHQKVKAESLSKTMASCRTFINESVGTPQHWNQEYENILKQLSAYEIYDKLSKVTSDDNTCAKYCANIINSSEDIDEFKKLCPKLASNIMKLSETLKDTNSPYDRCTYMTYWTYEKIINIFNSHINNVHNKSVINELNKAVLMANSELTDKDKCLFSFTGNLLEWKGEKFLHDYFKNYDKIRTCITSTDGNSCNSYCGYLKHISKLYYSYINKCCSCYSYPERACFELCPKYFNCDISYFPNDLLSKIGCQEDEEKKEKGESNKTAEEVFKNITVDHDVIRRSQIAKPCKGLICDSFDTFALSSFLFLGIFLHFLSFTK